MKGLKNKTGFLVFVLLMLVLATMLGFLLTQGRYSEELQSGSDMYDSELEYIVADQVEVNSVEEFIAAVENGYSNITIADGVDNPLIITSGITDVGADLIIDLNGHEIQRNNREPMLNIIEGVRVTVIDSSTSQTGSFYNPVGSVLQIDGGTLTVTAGTFTSGPRSEEYADTGTYKSESGGHMESTASLTVRVKSGSGYTESTVAAPIILPSVKKETDGITTRYFVNGNMYFDEAWTAPASVYSSELIEPDTYFYFVIDDDTVSNTSIAASENSADFYYTYNVRRNEGANGDVSYSYAESAEEGDNVVPVTIYGYHNVKSSADPEGSDTTPDYATVKMMSGNMYTRGGAYKSLFGEENTYGIYASGGYMAVNAGAFSAKEAATCVACAYGADASSSEFLQVTGGSFSSEYGDTVSVSGGNMVLTGGRFTLNANNAPEGNDSAAVSAAVSVMGGTLNASNASGLEFYITANALDTSVTYGIMVDGGTADIRNAAFTFADDAYTYTGVRGVSVSGGSATLIDTDFTFGGTGSTYTDAIGISAEGGRITATNVDISINSSIVSGTPGNANRGIYSDGGTVQLYGDCTINIDGTYSAGILAVSPTSSSSSSAERADSIIYGSAGDESEYTLKIDVSGTAESVLSSTAMSTEGGSINFASGNVSITSDGLGVTTRSGGGITFSGTTFNVDTANGTGIYVNGGDIKFTSGTVTVTSTIATNNDGATAAHTWSGAPGESSVTSFYDGIVVQGGSLVSTDAELNVTHHGINNNYDGNYSELIINSYAVRVTAGGGGSTDVKITNGKLTNDSGGGLYVSGGTVTLGTENSTESDSLSIITSGKNFAKNNGGYYTNPDQSNSNSNWNYMKNVNGGNAVDVDGGIITVHYGTYASAFGNGVLVSNGTANIYGGTFAGNDPYDGNDGTPLAGSAASYGLKMYGGILNVYGGTFGNTTINNVSYDGSGAFITGMGSAGQGNAIANIYAGTFNATGRIGVSIMRNSEVYFGGDKSGANTNMSPKVQGNIGAIAIEAYKDGSYSDVTIYSGTYSGGGNSSYNDGLWYGDRTTSLTIISGTFSANGNTARSGLYFDCGSAPDGGVVQISGGTFTGGQPEHNWGGNYYTNGGAIGATIGRSWGNYTGVLLRINNIFTNCRIDCGNNNIYDAGSDEYLCESVTAYTNVNVTPY